VARLERALDEARGERDALAADVSDLKRSVGERDATLGYVGAEVESVKTMFATREEDLRRERDELAALVAERDEHEAAVRNEANAAREDAARAKAEAAEALADLAEKRESVDRVEAEAKETVRRVEGEMRALLAEVAAQRRKTRELGSALQSMYA
jgi:chromosome segregation ATPase